MVVWGPDMCCDQCIVAWQFDMLNSILLLLTLTYICCHGAASIRIIEEDTCTPALADSGSTGTGTIIQYYGRQNRGTLP